MGDDPGGRTLNLRWFGEPWPREQERSGVCEDDRLKVEPPIGKPCIHCPDPIAKGERGVLMAAALYDDLGFEADFAVGERVCASHIDCLIRAIVGYSERGCSDRPLVARLWWEPPIYPGRGDAPELENGWVTWEHNPLLFTRRSDGKQIDLHGVVMNGPPGTVVFRLPEGYRPEGRYPPHRQSPTPFIVETDGRVICTGMKPAGGLAFDPAQIAV